MERLLLIAVVGLTMTLLLRTVKAELAAWIGVITAGLLVLSVLGELTDVMKTLQRLAETYSVPTEFLAVLLKILAIAYLTKFGADLCRDNQQQAIAGKLEFGGRVLILACILPSVIALLELGLSLLKETL